MKAIGFEDGHRVRFFGSVVDHVFIGELKVQAATAHLVDSSDHNPMSISLSI